MLSPSHLRPSGIFGISNVVHQRVHFPFRLHIHTKVHVKCIKLEVISASWCAVLHHLLDDGIFILLQLFQYIKYVKKFHDKFPTALFTINYEQYRKSSLCFGGEFKTWCVFFWSYGRRRRVSNKNFMELIEFNLIFEYQMLALVSLFHQVNCVCIRLIWLVDGRALCLLLLFFSSFRNI